MSGLRIEQYTVILNVNNLGFLCLYVLSSDQLVLIAILHSVQAWQK